MVAREIHRIALQASDGNWLMIGAQDAGAFTGKLPEAGHTTRRSRPMF